jgi:hypothetical protein
LGTQGLKVTTAAHSLGNMVVASALWDYEVGSNIVDRHMAFDAAIPIEALDGTEATRAGMLNADWYDHIAKVDRYPMETRASEWHKLFLNRAPLDRRDELTWRDRFNNMHQRHPNRDLLVNRWWNFYSSGEEVLRNANTSTDFNDVLINTEGNRPVLNTTGEYGWAIQEKIKGVGPEKGFPYRFLPAVAIVVPRSFAPIVGMLGVVGAIKIPELAKQMGGITAAGSSTKPVLIGASASPVSRKSCRHGRSISRKYSARSQCLTKALPRSPSSMILTPIRIPDIACRMPSLPTSDTTAIPPTSSSPT